MQLFKFALFTFFCLNTTMLCAQVSPEVRKRRRDLLEGVLRTIIESQPAQPAPVARPEVIKPVVVNSPAHQKIEAELGHFSNEINQLVGNLRKECLNDVHLRPLLADLLKVKSNTDILLQVVRQHHDLNYVASQYPIIDRDWRILSNQLLQERNLSVGSREFVGHINEHDTNLLKLLKIKPQLNRRELIRLISSLQTHLAHLQQDLFYELQGHPQRAKLVKQCQQIQSRCRQATALIDHGEYETVVAAYQEAVKDWRPFTASLRKVCGERTRKDIVEIEQIARVIQQQLWLPDVLDHEYLGQLVASAEQDVDRVLGLISFAELMNTDDPGSRLIAARRFKSASLVFLKSLEQRKAVKDLIWDFRIYEKAWLELHSSFACFARPQIKVAPNWTADEIGLVKTSIGDGPGLTRRELIEMAAALDRLCSQFELVVRTQVKTSGHYEPRYRVDFAKSANILHDVSHHFYDSLVNRETPEHITADLEQIVAQWKTCRTYFSTTVGQERATLNEYRVQLEPLLVKLQLVFSE